MDAQKLSNLKDFIQQCEDDPTIINHPSLSFFTHYLRYYRASVDYELPPYVDKYKSETLDDSDNIGITAETLRNLREFIGECINGDHNLDDPSFFFLMNYLDSFGCHKLPSPGYTCGPLGNRIWKEYDPTLDELNIDDMDHEDVHHDDDMDHEDESDDMDHEDEEEIVQSDVEFEGEIVEPDNDPPQKMGGDSSVEVTEENRNAAQESKGKAMGAVSEGEHEEAIEHLTHAIMLNPASAMMYATRASVYIKMKKPVAAIRDADAAIEINPDVAKCHKSRGMARAMLGQWKEAAKDLHVASNIDYDEEIGVVLKKVESNVRKIEENQRKYDRLRKERDDRKAESERQRRKAKAKSAYVTPKKEEVLRLLKKGFLSTRDGFLSSGGSGGMLAGFHYSNAMLKVSSGDPEIMEAIQNSEFVAAIEDVVKDSANFEKYMLNPPWGPMLAKLFAPNQS